MPHSLHLHLISEINENLRDDDDYEQQKRKMNLWDHAP